MRDYPYSFHVALDGNGINGLEGMAGVCLFLYNPGDNSYAYKIKYYQGIAGGHAVNVNPAGTYGFSAMPGSICCSTMRTTSRSWTAFPRCASK